jgi:copper chaperone
MRIKKIKLSGAKMKKIFKIDGMSCNHCVMSVNKSLSKLNLNDLKVFIGTAEVDYDENKTKESEVVKAIEEAGYKVVK